MEERAYQFDLTVQPKPIIKVVGVGGGGSNAVNFMYNQGFRDVEFVVCNTDSQALRTSPVPNKIQLGGSFLGGLGAGAIPENGREAANISEEAIREVLADGTKMVFITAGMGGGTGTGAAPVIAKIARELGILTIGIVTKPFRFEGPRKNQAAENGITEMRKYCDTVIEILNDKIRDLFGNLAINQAFAQADHVLSTSAKSLSEIITVPGIINVDFKDIETTMKDSGTAVMGSAVAKGDHRGTKAIQEAISSPLLNNNEIEGATKVLLAISYGHAPELTLEEFYEITDFLQQRTGENAEVIFGTSMDPELGDSIQVTVIATGFDSEAQEPNRGMIKEHLLQREGLDNTHFGSSQPRTEPVPVSTFSAPAPVQEPVIQRSVETRQPVTATVNVPPATPSAAPASAPVQTNEVPKEYLNIDGEYQLVYNSPPDVERPLENISGIMQQFGAPAPSNHDRAAILRRISQNAAVRTNYDDPEFIRSNEQPAYLRKQNGGAPSQDAMSRYTINDNNEILNNNRYLHDNVD
jgi:cell division protein FtsZ